MTALCYKRLSSASHLKYHIAGNYSTSKGPTYPCGKCDFFTHHKANLTAHMKNIHSNYGKKYVCYFCGKKFSFFSQLVGHFRKEKYTLEKGAIHYCKKCEYNASQRSQLTSHISRIHGGETKKIECYFCAKKFFMFSNLANHLGRMHNLEK